MKYMLLIYSNPAVWEALSDEERAALGPEHAALIEELVESGEWVGGSVLAAPSQSRTVRVRDGAALTTDGPFAEVKEHMAGYDIVDCVSVERALEIAARIPDARLSGVEVRPLG
ncbi:YciI family protein [Streptomyces griseus]|uniref:YCII-related domain-containing protein n=1 Tax=Streptomyces griseus subsp. griseus (strain JCM 4626 / CBS 651.72 / NBRC 13350 / KCC S-0626 / ISP 5235) TaxID=455632 RepID=B1VRN1_STRGG|nr:MULTISPECIES: YciI family protein [Streptomyces]MYR11187.1 YciI family protein [Streptomyces sp. SID724]MYR48186.1 YciI family protein [Streptomyces sp. SID4928]MYT78981.1 YciI family protein [Streptomyces sp. SID8364]EGE40105.1 YCII-related protein [Streptomyces sp. ACT-1]MBW3703089.1 YciI family protein [Streptomyces griseus]